MTIYAIYVLTTAILMALKFNWFLYAFTKEGRIRYSMFLTMFLLINWEFATHYLQAAYLFHASIQAYNTGDDSLLVKRKLWLRLLEIFGYAFFLVAFVCLTINIRWVHWMICW